MLKIGIISHYYKSLNYGGNLQAYALCKVVSEYGAEAEQICFPLKGQALPWEKVESGLVKKIQASLKNGMLIHKALHRVKRNFQKSAVKFFIPNLNKKRSDAFSYFSNTLIPHGDKVYDSKSIVECAGDYDVFITGSDQVWNFRWYNPAYFLDFVPEGKLKFSYGASLSMDSLTDEGKSLFKKSLEHFTGISVREKNTSIVLSEILARPVEWVLDPTLLLTREQWDKVCAVRKIKDKYLFCYFLGNAGKERKLAQQFAKKKNLKVVTIPHLDGEVVWRDMYFGDIKCEAPSPEELLSLIKHAEYVFTDSFHATVFASIYEKEYFVFRRKGHRGMDSRIYTLTQLLGTENRFCNSGEKLCVNYLLGCDSIDYSGGAENLREIRDKSLDYLKECLKKSKEKIDVNEG